MFRAVKAAKLIGRTIASCVQDVALSCPDLKTLVLNVVSFPAFFHPATLAAADGCATVTALSDLKVNLEHLTVIGLANNETHDQWPLPVLKGTRQPGDVE